MQDLNDKVTAGTLPAAEWNEVPSEIQNVIEGLGITLSGGDLNQLGKAIAGYVANGTFYTDSGAADAYVLTTIGSKQSLTAYTDGNTFEFIADNANTGASTVNVATLGVKNITHEDGTDPAAGDINGRMVLKFDSANDRCEIVNRPPNLIVITASGSYSKPDGLKKVEVTVIGAGGGGGGVDGQAASTFAAGGGGGGGGTATKEIQASALSASETVTVGAKGAGGTGTAGGNGGTGGTSSFGAHAAGSGGTGGVGTVASTTLTTTLGGVGGFGTSGDVNAFGDSASIGVAVAAGSTGASGGTGGGSFLSGGGRGATNDSVGDNAGGFGGGGGGAAVTTNTADFNGGDGADGIILVKEFF